MHTLSYDLLMREHIIYDLIIYNYMNSFQIIFCISQFQFSFVQFLLLIQYQHITHFNTKKAEKVHYLRQKYMHVNT
jgi:hypothetical protein